MGEVGVVMASGNHNLILGEPISRLLLHDSINSCVINILFFSGLSLLTAEYNS